MMERHSAHERHVAALDGRRLTGRPIRAALLAALLLLGCNVDSGDLTVTVVKSWEAVQDPFLAAKSIRVRVDGPGLLVGPAEFSRNDGRGILSEVPVGANRRITVEGLGYEDNPVSRGRTGRLEIREGDNAIELFVGLIEEAGAFSSTSVKQLLVPRAFHSATRLGDGSVLICGGITTDWQPENDKGSPPPTPTATMERIDGNSLRVLVASPATCKPGATGCMVSGRVGHSATLLESGNVLVAGGSDGAQLVDRVEIFSPDDNRFVRAAELNSPRLWHQAVPSADGALLVGGEATAGMALPGELFSGGEVETKPALKQGRRAFTLTRLADETLVVAGGIDQTGRVLDTIELLSPGSPTWTAAMVKMKAPRAHHSASLMQDGTIVFIGGLPSLDAPGNNSVERFDPQNDVTRLLTANLGTQRWGHSATLLSDGRVLVVGGFSGNRLGGAPTAVVEQITFFDSGSVQIRKLASLRHARAGHTATMLDSGFLLVVGGFAACALLGSQCTLPADCCSLSCAGGKCSSGTCAIAGETCTAPADCCSEKCESGSCGSLSRMVKTAEVFVY